MRHFKLPLIVTGIMFALVLTLGVAGAIAIAQSGGSNREKEARAQMLGSGSAMLLGVVVAPFWWIAAAKLGKERRAAKKSAARPALPATKSGGAPLPPRRR